MRDLERRADVTAFTVDATEPRRDRVRRRERDRRRAAVVLALVVLVFVVVTTLIAMRTPAWESADEPGHVQNIESLVGGHWYRMGPSVGTEAHQPPLYYLMFAGWQRVIDKPARPVAPGPAALGRSAKRGLFRHHSAADHRFLLWLRLPNILLGVGTILLTAFAIRQLTADPWTPVVAASIVAMTPRFVFLSSFVTNDNLAFLLGALLTLLALRFVAKPTAWRMAFVGGNLGLLLLTKFSALPVAAVVVVLLVPARSWLERGRLFLVALAAALAVSWWYLVQNYRWYGDPLARHASERYLESVGGLGTFGTPYRVHDPIGLIVQHVPGRFVSGFWYTSGWNQFRWSWPAGLLLWLLLAASLVGLAGARASKVRMATLAVIAIAGLVSVWIVAFQTKTYEARLAFTGLPALAGLAALGTQRWKLPLRFFLPAAEFVGLLIAVHHDVLAVRWWR